MLRGLVVARTLAIILGPSADAHSRPPAKALVLTPTTPQAEDRDQSVSPEDLAILMRAEALLRDASAWDRADDRECQDHKATGKRSLTCALQRARISVLGVYDHRRAALQEVRFVVEDATRGRQFEHRRRDFNTLPTTRIADVERVRAIGGPRLASASCQTSRRSGRLFLS